ncbi:MAG: PQQ-like beta-propeller repeat protein, partial [Kiritimatiellae bacterium]|nr:PQQ-like beta-propeller repeat protein [Kiritimatiellia bacterium]
MRTSLETGETLGIISGGAFPWITPAVRGTMVIARGFDWLKDEILAVDFETKRERLWQDKESASPVICSHALTRNHVVVGLFTGELLVLDLIPQKNKEPFRFLTPSGKPIGSSPSVSGGKIYFGCDDGCLYVLGPANEIHQSRDDLRGAEALVGDKLPDPVVARRSSPISASRANYHWPSCLGNPANTCHVNDPDFKAPLRLRWVSRGYGHFKTPLVASEEGDLLSITLIHGIVTCQEQMTGRLRWRVRCPPTGWAWSNSSGLLVTGGRVYVPRPNDRKEGLFMCLNLQDGSTIWTQPIGGRGIWARSSPVLAGGKVAFAFATKAEPPPCLIRAWDVATGKPSWEVELNVSGNRAGALAGCTDGTVMYFTAGAEAWQWKQEGNKKRGEAVAIEAATGKVLWRSDEFFGSCCPVLAGDRLLLNDYAHALNCVNPKDGSLIWRTDRSSHTHFSVGADHIVSRGYGGWASKLRLEDGKPYPGVQRGEQLGGDAHACGPVVLTPNLSIAVTVAGLHLRDVQTGSLLWLSPGFAARACVNPSMALGRLFFPSATSGTIFCWESSR